MGGTAVSSGADNQASVAAYVAVRMLLEWPLNWAPEGQDIPVAVEGEVAGPGDDLRIEFGTRRAPFEVQCKRTLAGQAALASTITDIADQLATVPPANEIVLIVGSGGSPDVRDVFATDVRNFRQGRRDGFRRITKSVLSTVSAAQDVFSRLYVITLDVDRESGTGAQFALDGLRQALTEPTRAEEAWAVLIRHALRLGQRGRWDRAAVEKLLISNGFKLRPLGPDARWVEQIDYARRLISRWRPRTAAGVLDHLATELDGKPARAKVRQQFHRVRGAAALTVGDVQGAREHFGRALEHFQIPLTGASSLGAEDLKDWLTARYNYAVTLSAQGDDAKAEAIAREILQFDSRHVLAWSLLAIALDHGARAPESPPADLTDAPEYRDAEAHIAARRGNWAAAASVLAPALAAGERSPSRLNEHVQALINWSAELADNGEKIRMLEEAERTADEAVRLLENTELEHQLARALFSRGRAREGLKRKSDAAIDYDRAAVLAPTDPNVVIRTVVIRQRKGDLPSALSLLTNDVVESAVILRVLRAEVRAESGDRDGALKDIEQALDELPSVATPRTEKEYLNAGALALDLGRLETAERAVVALEAGGLADDGPEAGVMRARIELARGDWNASESTYRAAASRAASDSGKILGEFATQLSVADRHEQAIGVYEEIGANDPAHPIFSNLVLSLMRAGSFERVVELQAKHERAALNRGETAAALPASLLDAAIDVAWRREDFATAVRLLEARLHQQQKTGDTPSVGLVLNAADAHSRMDDAARTTVLIDSVLARDDLAPENRMRAANVLVAIGAHQRAIDTAFLAVRGRPSEKRMIANFISVMLAPALENGRESPNDLAADVTAAETDGEVADAVEADLDDDDENGDVGSDGRTGTVVPDTFVRVRTEDGQRYDYFIYRDPPADPRLGEYLIDDAAVVDLVGKSVGDIVVRNRGTWNEQRLRVTRVLPAVVIVFRRYMQTFAAQFPEDANFRMFNVGKTPTLESLGPIMAAMHAGAARADEALQQYERVPVPLGLLAKVLGKPLVELVVGLASDPSRSIHTDAPPYSDYDLSLRVAVTSKAIVLTRPALVFIENLGLWDTLATRYRLLAPRSMMEKWAEEIRELRKVATYGRVSMREVAGRPVLDTIPDGVADTALDASQSLYERVASTATVLHRPASALSEEDDRLRDLIGASSFDAAALARSEGAALYADDLGLRAIAQTNYGAESFPTAAFLEASHGDGAIDDNAFECSVIRLVGWGHKMVPVRGSTIAMAFGSAGSSVRTAAQVIATLADSRVTTASAVVVAVGALRTLATADIATTTLDDAATQIVDALILNREAPEVISIFISLLSNAFRLLPHQHQIIHAVVRRAIAANRIVKPGQ